MPGPDPNMYWMLIAVLSSTIPLSPQVASRLYQAAYRLHCSAGNVEKLQGDLLSGKVVRLDRDVALGSITGPAFEAEIATERGEGLVRFLLTRQGLEATQGAARAETEDQPRPPHMLN